MSDDLAIDELQKANAAIEATPSSMRRAALEYLWDRWVVGPKRAQVASLGRELDEQRKAGK